MHVVARTAAKGGIKRPEVLRAIEDFQAHMQADPALGGVKALPALVRSVNRLTHSDDPRWMQIPDNANEVGGLMFTYMASSPIPGALKEFSNICRRSAVCSKDSAKTCATSRSGYRPSRVASARWR